MPNPSQVSLTGLWHGQYEYPRSFPPEFFVATLLESPNLLGGSIQETMANGKFAGKTFYASVSGQRTGNHVRFTKRYETLPRLHHVHYEGTLSGDGLEIEGIWSVPGNWSGRFLMIRHAGLTLADEKSTEISL